MKIINLIKVLAITILLVTVIYLEYKLLFEPSIINRKMNKACQNLYLSDKDDYQVYNYNEV